MQLLKSSFYVFMCCYTVFVVLVTFSGHLTVKHHFCLFLVGFEALLADGGEQPSTSGSSGSVYKRTDLSSMLNIYHAAKEAASVPLLPRFSEACVTPVGILHTS